MATLFKKEKGTADRPADDFAITGCLLFTGINFLDCNKNTFPGSRVAWHFMASHYFPKCTMLKAYSK